ncbi:MAG: hypothetical protein A3H52_00845 [Candidatus Zambryskibacteria bacterium RIFCSPLOWO2_02_FULL_39_26]|uniref:Uncharacterized protein n=1 Tax=Candidatus Zambryskibacteria bacterium RIFCSPLOWO2_12_FULL_39_23 TaxID=1802776 RepID=A0A1G2UT95_9BACT|nr:MAG: hypothetical protein A2W51_00490 [Candidatus Zambryskibacteria bacterium RIFCSPHIGHO2_02_39_10]OHA99861.1 MAG: hypothetical protein A3E59_02375 [Candidatus Zambryskibacteria bacterium RIFCSPHIGHO2_12_FULL_39_47]OHB10266.1 MAG: hypothetical protein A3H52_00845 [Candidatus Zambryskibacteria bacterium RIFCSPLOWO2_02_FULL_39_26]OHB12605.1 MAG: hypothetical protein A3G99_02180 [Candidatus Zambryskibacteria bacterium RIFCSPLOWO2_12_FULL_39_23]
MNIRPGMPDHIRRLVLAGDGDALRDLAARRRARERNFGRARGDRRPVFPPFAACVPRIDGKSRAAGERDDD